MPGYAELEAGLRAAGFEPTTEPPVEKRSAWSTIAPIAIYVAGRIADDEIDLLVAAVRAWVAQWFRPLLQRRQAEGQTIPIYGANGEVLREVHVSVEDKD